MWILKGGFLKVEKVVYEAISACNAALSFKPSYMLDERSQPQKIHNSVADLLQP